MTMVFTSILKSQGAAAPSSVRSEASRKAWLKRQRAAAPSVSDRHSRLSDHYDQYDDPDVTPSSILAALSPEDRNEVAQSLIRSKSAPLTVESDDYTYVDDNGMRQFTPERKALHAEIIASILSDAAIAAATPAEGEAPTFIVLGGRGGSGKSSFTHSEDKPAKLNEFDSRKFIVMDSDAIKARLNPPYAGWNANSVHDESSVVFDDLTFAVASMGLNFVHDATLRSDGVKSTIEYVKSQGYRVEGHYMFVPRQVAAQRAVSRFLGGGPGRRGRLVPVDAVLANTNNERNFDKLVPQFDKWSAYDNQGSEPKLISRG